MENTQKAKYVRPLLRDLNSLSAAEGGCFTGTIASGSTCTAGVSTMWCSTGGTASVVGNPPNCLPGGTAGNCITGAFAGG